MLMHSRHSPVPPHRFRATLRHQAGFIRFPLSAAKRIAGRRSARTEASAIRPALSIEDAIRGFVDAQPGQLYRGGA